MRSGHVAQCIGVALLSTGLAAAQIVPFQQLRETRASGFNPRCTPNSALEAFTAPDFTPFSATADTLLDCGGAMGSSVASQASSIETTAILIDESCQTAAESDSQIVIQGVARSAADITFDIASDTTISLRGLLQASRSGLTGQAFTCAAQLRDGNGAVLFGGGLLAPPDGSTVSEVVDVDIAAPAGRYRWLVNLQGVVDSSIPPGGGGVGAIRVRLSIAERCATDIDGNGVTDLLDLALLLREFGCNQGCIADVDDNGATDLPDLAALLTEFGSACP